MPELRGGLLGCYRCGNVWRPRKSPVRICPRCKSRLWNIPPTAARRPPRSGGGLGRAELIGARSPALRALLAEYGAFNVRLFGSAVRSEAGPGRDIDLLVQFRRPVGLLALEELRERAAQLLGRPVDIGTESSLHGLVRPHAIAEAEPL